MSPHWQHEEGQSRKRPGNEPQFFIGRTDRSVSGLSDPVVLAKRPLLSSDVPIWTNRSNIDLSLASAPFETSQPVLAMWLWLVALIAATDAQGLVSLTDRVVPENDLMQNHDPSIHGCVTKVNTVCKPKDGPLDSNAGWPPDKAGCLKCWKENEEGFTSTGCTRSAVVALCEDMRAPFTFVGNKQCTMHNGKKPVSNPELKPHRETVFITPQTPGYDPYDTGHDCRALCAADDVCFGYSEPLMPPYGAPPNPNCLLLVNYPVDAEPLGDDSHWSCYAKVMHPGVTLTRTPKPFQPFAPLSLQYSTIDMKTLFPTRDLLSEQVPDPPGWNSPCGIVGIPPPGWYSPWDYRSLTLQRGAGSWKTLQGPVCDITGRGPSGEGIQETVYVSPRCVIDVHGRLQVQVHSTVLGTAEDDVLVGTAVSSGCSWRDTPFWMQFSDAVNFQQRWSCCFEGSYQLKVLNQRIHADDV